MADLYAPNGLLIIGTREIIPGVALIEGGTAHRTRSGFSFEYLGETEIDWDGQETVTREDSATRRPERVFYDADYNEWLEPDLVLRDGSEDEEGEEESEEEPGHAE